MSKRLKVTAEDTNASMVYDVVATIRQHDGLNYHEIARILDEPDISTYKALRYAEDQGYIHGDGGYYVNKGAGGARSWHFDRLAPYPYEIMNGKRHAYIVKRAVTGQTQYTIGGTYANGQTWHKTLSMVMEVARTAEHGAHDIGYKTPEPTTYGHPHIIYKPVALFNDIKDAEHWIRRDKKRLQDTPVNVYYYHKRVLIPSGLMCPRQGAD